jgi:hypothetical protein
MKRKVFGLIVITTIGIAILSNMGYFGGETIQIRGQYIEYNCVEDNINMKVISVSDSAQLDLIGKTVSPEASFKQSTLDEFIKNHLKAGGSSKDFYLVGSIKKRPIRHCSGSACFKVDMIKQENEQSYTEF